MQLSFVLIEAEQHNPSLRQSKASTTQVECISWTKQY